MMTMRWWRPLWSVAGLVVALHVTWGGRLPSGFVGASWAAASPQRNEAGRDARGAVEAFDPARFLDQFFGHDRDAQQRKLAEIEITPQEEKRFGDQALQAFLAELRQQRVRVLSRGPEVEYLQSLVRQLQPQMRRAKQYRAMTVLLADTPDTDARCFPGGTLVVFRGMLTLARNEAAVVAILGHEMSHIDHGHQLRHLKSLKLAQQTFAAPQGVDFQRMMDSSMFVAQSFARPFQPEEETEADEDGVTWAYRLGYDPLQFAHLFLRMQERDGNKPDWRDAMPSFFRSHPAHGDRYQAVVARVEELKRREPRGKLYVGEENLRRLIPRSKHAYDE
jgi:predicted Zn-dependent protease